MHGKLRYMYVFAITFNVYVSNPIISLTQISVTKPYHKTLNLWRIEIEMTAAVYICYAIGAYYSFLSFFSLSHTHTQTVIKCGLNHLI